MMQRCSRGGTKTVCPLKLMTFSVAAIAAGMVALSPAQAADPDAGKALAVQWCSSCHLVSDDQPTAASASTPSFYDIGSDPDWTVESIATFLADPHPKMPDMSLTTIETTNLASYIKSLAR